MTDITPLLQLQDLHVTFETSTGVVEALRGINFTMYPGQSVAIVGESGSGKSTAAMSVLGLLPGTGKVSSGKIFFDGRDITHLTEKEWPELRGSHIGLVPQDPMSNLNPVYKVGDQVQESLSANNVVPGSEMEQRVEELLAEAGLRDVDKRARQYPHEFSGGMRQRALIAIGLAARPKLLIADEPTSALDVTVQKQILDHLGEMTQELGTAVLFITHDLGLAAERAQHLVVMHRGRIVESGSSQQILDNPRHPYTKRLVEAAPSLTSTRLHSARKTSEPVITVENLVKEFDVRDKRGKKEKFTAVDDVSFTVTRGTTTALVGESGSGKSTVANMALGLLKPTSGRVLVGDQDVAQMSGKELFDLRRKVQVVFQNPYASLDPMYSIYRCIEEPLRLHKIGDKKSREKRVAELLDMVALPASSMRRFPNELSGGQRQRVAIARAMALDPEIIVLDEAVSALDVLVQDQILRLLAGLQDEHDLTYLFITHDLAVVREMADDIVVMQQGKLVEAGPVDHVFAEPATDYTRNLINSVPGLALQHDVLQGR